MLQGSYVALVTPFLENEKIDFESFSKLVHSQIEQGTNGLVICGTTGESPALSNSEQLSLIECAVKEARGRIPIIAGTGSNHTETAVFRTKAAKEAGADVGLVVFPYYNRPTFEGCLAHFERVSECGLPTIVYYHPGRTGVRLSVKQLSDISSLPLVVGIKDASGDVDYGLELINSTKVSVFSGDDTLSLPLIACGAKGCISIVGNLIPDQWGTFIRTAINGEFIKARQLYQQMASLCKAMVLETNPQCVKYALSVMGKCQPIFRLPLVMPQEQTRRAIDFALSNIVKSSRDANLVL
jgi:4-hydroxy-tetrahydrodipicolinate synthase